jgi:hypothetical protein
MVLPNLSCVRNRGVTEYSKRNWVKSKDKVPLINVRHKPKEVYDTVFVDK